MECRRWKTERRMADQINAPRYLILSQGRCLAFVT